LTRTKLTLFFLFCLVCPWAKGQIPVDTVSLDQNNFHVAFSVSAKYPVKVYWRLTYEMVSCKNPLDRSGFAADPQLKDTNFKKDYTKSGYDTGHNFNAQDNACNFITNKNCWYYTNMTPQVKELNRGPWKSLETQCRKWAKSGDDLFIQCGSYGKYKVIGPHQIWVPVYCWKYVRHSNGKAEAYIMPNNVSISHKPYKQFKVTIKQLHNATGLNFK
jgi:DNA/RNA endonuclease G (NUC1)